MPNPYDPSSYAAMAPPPPGLAAALPPGGAGAVFTPTPEEAALQAAMAGAPVTPPVQAPMAPQPVALPLPSLQQVGGALKSVVVPEERTAPIRERERKAQAELDAAAGEAPAAAPAARTETGPAEPPLDLGAVAYTTPGTSSTQSQTSKSFTSYTPEQRAELASLAAAGDESAAKLVDKIERADFDAMLSRQQQVFALQEQAEIQQQAAANTAAIAQQRQAKLAEYDARLNKLQEEYGSGEVQPYWVRKGTAGSILGAIGIAIGALAQAKYSADQNAGLRIIENAIRSDMEVQKTELARKREQIAGVRSLRADAAGAFDDQIAQEQAQLSLGLAAAGAQAKQWAIKLEGTEAGTRAAQLVDQIEQRRIATHQAALEAQAPKVVQQSSTSTTAGQQVTVGETLGYDKAPDREGRYVPEVGGNAATKEEAVKVREAAAKASSLTTRLEEMRRIQQEGLGSKLGAAKRARYESLRQGALQDLTVLRGQGAMSEGDAGRAEAQIPALQYLGTSGAEGALGGVIDSVQGNVKAYLRQVVTPVIPEAIPAVQRARIRYQPGEIFGSGGEAATRNFQASD